MSELDELPSSYAEIGQARWVRWRRKHAMDNLIPNDFGDVLAHVINFSDPVIDGDVTGRTWKPNSRSWERTS